MKQLLSPPRKKPTASVSEKAVEIIRAYGTDRTFYGCDYPMWNPKEELERFLALPLTDKEREDILWNNAANMFGL